MSTYQEAAQRGIQRNFEDNLYVAARSALDCPYDLKKNGNPRVHYHEFVMTCTGALADLLLSIKADKEKLGKKRTVNITDVELQFIIHGVWGGQIWVETNEKGEKKIHHRSLKNLKKCNFKFKKFDRAVFESLEDTTRKGLQKHWPDISKEKNKQSYSFIRKEWNGHSICSDMEAEEFYGMVVHVVSNHLDLEDALRKQGIVPDDNQGYPASSISDALKSHFAATFAIGWQTIDNVRYLYDIRARAEWKDGSPIHSVPKFMDHDKIYICLDKDRAVELDDSDLLIFKGFVFITSS